MNENTDRFCKYCNEILEDCVEEGLDCKVCQKSVHIKCLKSKGVPGGLHGDVFFIFTCQECAPNQEEQFQRDKLSWLKILTLAFYHLQTKSPGLSRRGFFHWRNHVAALIDKNWEYLFQKKRKKWVGTVAGTLSHFSNVFFKSGTAVINEPAWWALNYPKLSPNMVSTIYSAFTLEKQKIKILKNSVPDSQLFNEILEKYVKNKDLLVQNYSWRNAEKIDQVLEPIEKPVADNLVKRKSLLPTLESTSRKLIKLNKIMAYGDDSLSSSHPVTENNDPQIKKDQNQVQNREPVLKLLDPMCYYNTALSLNSKEKATQMKTRLMGNTRKDLILSPYSAIYLKPYIRRDVETIPLWLKLMAEIQLKANIKNKEFKLPARAPIDYTYVQPEHIPAVNSLCNNFFWPGIDMTECLQYPDFSCIVMYKKLIVGFAFLVPNVGHTENYISFIFTRPGWRNVGIGKFMLYHLIQTSLGKDITMHVSINNPALFLYQKFGFKVESVVLNFYDKYLRADTKESKHAFFCRLER